MARAARTRRPSAALWSGDHIDDSLRDNDDFFRGFSGERPPYLLELEDRRFYIGCARIPGHRDVGAFFAVHLHRQRDGLLDQQLLLERGPGGFRDERLAAKRGPAFL